MPAPAASSVPWFEIGAPDVNAAKAFYRLLFGWSFMPDGAYTLITAPGADPPVRRRGWRSDSAARPPGPAPWR